MLMRGEWCELQQLVRFQGASVGGVTLEPPQKGAAAARTRFACRGAGLSPRDGLRPTANGVFLCQKYLFPMDT